MEDHPTVDFQRCSHLTDFYGFIEKVEKKVEKESLTEAEEEEEEEEEEGSSQVKISMNILW